MHSDPDHGRLWSHDTVVVSIGETRRFNLREIPSDVLPNKAVNKNQKGSESKSKFPKGDTLPETEQEHHSFHLYDGDVFYMKDDCQETFQHCVMKSEGPTNNSPRSSIVFKKSLPGLGGKRGHGLVKIKQESQKESSAITSNRLDSTKGISIANNKSTRTGFDNMKLSKPKPFDQNKKNNATTSGAIQINSIKKSKHK